MTQTVLPCCQNEQMTARVILMKLSFSQHYTAGLYLYQSQLSDLILSFGLDVSGTNEHIYISAPELSQNSAFSGQCLSEIGKKFLSVKLHSTIAHFTEVLYLTVRIFHKIKKIQFEFQSKEFKSEVDVYPEEKLKKI